MANHVTMADVAREAGVSLMTVSRVVNNKGEVSEATRKRILQVIDRLGYRPSGIARSLATSRTGTIGLIVPDISNPFFADLAKGVEHVAYSEGYNVFLCSTEEDPQRELKVLESLAEYRVDGVLLCSSRLDENRLESALGYFYSAVLVNRALESSSASVGMVLVDDVLGGKVATLHLLQSGHKRVGFLAGPEASHSGHNRFKGYRLALEETGTPYDPDIVMYCDSNVDGGYQATKALISARRDVTALFCYNDLVAVGALRACEEMGLKVPDDLSIVGFDDIMLAGLVTPPLTTCRIQRDEIGRRAARMLLEQMSGCSGECESVTFTPELIVRASAP